MMLILLDAHTGRELRKNMRKKSRAEKFANAIGGASRHKEFHAFIAHSLAGNGSYRSRQFLHRFFGFLFDPEAKLCRQADGAQKAQGIFGKSLARITHGS